MKNKYKIGNSKIPVQVFFSVLMGAMNMGQASPYVEAFSIARGAAAVIFGIIDRDSPIDSSSKDGIRPADLRGKLQLRNIKAEYFVCFLQLRPVLIVLELASLTLRKLKDDNKTRPPPPAGGKKFDKRDF